ncbi:hypothetical protein AWH62_01575 [Maricaulis sp. W15]|uniref:hypothetical protein n=1 Tax=Maricaulis sp. W15 TaxID=1772333 RepID=UPI000948B3FA|nr:hypothetical protein [Maricaulis sp. W15]OLF81388.1 hypothetical protein AWH62_01575 [Maricaulis sp. W15]
MFSGRKTADKLREEIRSADSAVGETMSALAADKIEAARRALSHAPKTHFADMGWKVGLAGAMIELKAGKRKQGLQKLITVCSRLDDTSLSRDDKNYLRLYALYRGSEASKDGRAPVELRELVEDFRFDHTLVTPLLRKDFPLKVLDDAEVAPPPPPPPPPVHSNSH